MADKEQRAREMLAEAMGLSLAAFERSWKYQAGQGRCSKASAISAITKALSLSEQVVEAAWLVEFPPSGDAYEGGRRLGPAQPTTWVAALIRPDHVGTRRTSDPNEALRFARREDAEGFISAWLRDDYGTHEKAFPSEHLWVPGT